MTTSDSDLKGRSWLSPNALMMSVIVAFTGILFLGLESDSSIAVHVIGVILIAMTILFSLRNVRRPTEDVGASDNDKTRETLHRTFLLLYVQFIYYWGTFAAGMYTNYYYVVPQSLYPSIGSIVSAVILSPDLFAHVLMAILSTSMSIPVIYVARTVGLKNVIRLHAGAIGARSIGFVMGPTFLYFSTSAISLDSIASPASLIMASVFAVAVFLTFLSRIFIVRKDVELKAAIVARPIVQLPSRSIDE